MTAEEVADMLRSSPGTIRKMARSGLIPAQRILKGQWRFSRQAIMAWLTERQVS